MRYGIIADDNFLCKYKAKKVQQGSWNGASANGAPYPMLPSGTAEQMPPQYDGSTSASGPYPHPQYAAYYNGQQFDQQHQTPYQPGVGIRNKGFIKKYCTFVGKFYKM